MHKLLDSPFQFPISMTWKNEVYHISGQILGYITCHKNSKNDLYGLVSYHILSDASAWAFHDINGHFRHLNWRYLPYIRPM